MKKISLIELIKRKYPSIPEKESFARILCGEVFVEGERVRDPHRMLAEGAEPQFFSKKYVSRGGIKLESVLQRWEIEVRDKIFIDAGSSTGGFTDCLLQKGARMVHSVDVGYNQLDYRLRTDARVKVYERTNIMTVGELNPAPHAAVADLSFRKIGGAAGHLLNLVRERWLIALVKPQFEMKAEMDPEFTGVVRTAELQEKILTDVLKSLEFEGIKTGGILPSSITGRKGNREYFYFLFREARTLPPAIKPPAVRGGGRQTPAEMIHAAVYDQ